MSQMKLNRNITRFVLKRERVTGSVVIFVCKSVQLQPVLRYSYVCEIFFGT